MRDLYKVGLRIRRPVGLMGLLILESKEQPVKPSGKLTFNDLSCLKIAVAVHISSIKPLKPVWRAQPRDSELISNCEVSSD